MSYDPVDRFIAREVGELCWHLVPHLESRLEKVHREPRHRAIWRPPEDEELRQIKAEDPPVTYPALLLDTDRQLDTIAGLIYAPRYGEPLRLSEYLRHLRRFLILQLTRGAESAAKLTMRAVRDFARTASTTELLEFVDLLWRGRWIVGSHDWAWLRLTALAGGDEAAVAALQADEERLQAEAFQLIQRERRLKDGVSSMEEWLHEIFCLLPAVHSVLYAFRRANQERPSDELEKLDRVLDEFQADIGTTLGLAFEDSRLAEEYIGEPLRKTGSVDAAVKQVRGVYRGRTIIPRVWYEAFAAVVNEAGSMQPSDVLARFETRVGQPDACANFGRAICTDRDPWLVLMSLEED